MTFFLLLSLAALIQAFAVSAVLTPVARAFGRRLGMIDRPDEARKIHDTPVPRSGGLAIFAAFWGCLALNLAMAAWAVPLVEGFDPRVQALAENIGLRLPQLAGLAAGSAIIFFLGALDDRFNLPPLPRLAIQVLAVVPLIATGTTLQLFLPAPVGWAVTVFWVVLLTNSLNFLDNMNGLTSGIAAIVSLVFALHSALAGELYMMVVFALLVGAVLGFWVFNFPKASIFLGDSGSTHLGFLLAALATMSTYYSEGGPSKLPVLLPVILLGVPLFDTLTVLFIRWRAGAPLMQGDRNHISHRLVDLGMSKVEAVLFLYGATLCVGLAAVALRPLDWRYGLAQAVMIVLVFSGLFYMERVSRRRLPPGPPAKDRRNE